MYSSIHLTVIFLLLREAFVAVEEESLKPDKPTLTYMNTLRNDHVIFIKILKVSYVVNI